MAWQDVHDPTGTLLFRYDPERSLVEIETAGLGLVLVDLERYQRRQAAPQEPQASETTPAGNPTGV